MLAHVCRNWRNVVFASPRRLNLRLCTLEKTPVRATLDIWPLLPIFLDVFIGGLFDEETDNWDEDNIIAALEHNNRVCGINFSEFPTSRSEKFLPAMHRPFPALTCLNLDFVGNPTPVQPDSFLGGSASRLQTLKLNSIPFPGLPKLLLSATHLVVLSVIGIPHSGYFPPEAIVSALSVLTCLEKLTIGFHSPRSRPKRRLPPETRTLLPILTELRFNGVDKYLEDLVARIDAPLLDTLSIAFLHQLIVNTPQLTRFIGYTPTSVRARGFATVKAYHRQWLRLIIDNCLSTLWDIKSFKPVIKWRIIGLLSPSKNIYVHFLKNPRKITPFTATLKNQDTCSLMR